MFMVKLFIIASFTSISGKCGAILHILEPSHIALHDDVCVQIDDPAANVTSPWFYDE
jgi:hypothetical protein